jgi:hypothetical protein
MPTPLAMRYCQASDLSLRVGRTGAAAGTSYTSFVFTNKSSTQCQLQGVPIVQILDAAGQPLSSPQTTLDFNDPSPVALFTGVQDQGGIMPAVVGQAQLTVGTPSAQCQARPSVRMLFTLPNGGGQLTAGWARSASAWVDCVQGRSVSPFASAIPPTPAPTPTPDFRVEDVLPPSVAVGQTLKYEVRLTNVSGRDIAFTTCPGYTVSLKPAPVRMRYVLNCRPVGLFKSGETVTFAMELPIASSDSRESFQSGPVPVTWWLDWPFQTRFSGIGRITLTAPGASP